jgi:hypothetical protein
MPTGAAATVLLIAGRADVVEFKDTNKPPQTRARSELTSRWRRDGPERLILLTRASWMVNGLSDLNRT